MSKELSNDWKAELFNLLQIQSDHESGILECAQYLCAFLRKINMDVILENGYSNPIIIAKTKNASKANILFYSHYDVKAAGDVNLWNTSPFIPQIIDGRIYCRGSGDAKGQIFSLLKGIEKVIAQGLDENFGISILLEGGEESGSFGLSETCSKYKEYLNSKLIILLDSHWISETPLIGCGCRGQVSCLLTCREKEFSNFLHAGNYGGIYDGAAFKMVLALNDFIKNNNIRAWFYNIEKPNNSSSSLTICGIKSGLMERSTIPHEAVSHIDMRLVDINESKLIEFIKNFFKEKQISVTVRQAEPSFKSIQNITYKKVIGDAITEACKCPPTYVDYIGAYLPMNKLSSLSIPQFIVPLAQSDENNHAPNENILVSHIHYGVKIVNNICTKFRWFNVS